MGSGEMHVDERKRTHICRGEVMVPAVVSTHFSNFESVVKSSSRGPCTPPIFSSAAMRLTDCGTKTKEGGRI